MTERPAPSPAQRFGTFAGVFTPTLLTILGVILYLRLGWVVGNAGLVGAWVIIGLATCITACTALSMSSLATNTRLEAGGPYAIIRRSLGLEVGGSIGLPLYMAQAVAVAIYIIGLREGWNWLFPSHPPLLVDLIAYTVIVGVSWISAGLAFRLQYAVMAVMGISFVVIVAGALIAVPPADPAPLFGSYPGTPEGEPTSFVGVFAVFFPAVTGITVGANMSGELRDPRRAIPWGTLGAMAVSTVIYLGMAWLVTRLGSVEELASNYTILVDKALWGPAVLLGLMGATFSSALATLVGAPRILAALARDEVLPGGRSLADPGANGEPRRALAVTAAIVLVTLALRDINLVAPLVTLFMLISYAVLNGVVLVEQGLGLISYRPTLRLHLAVPAIGLIGCIIAMFVVNPLFSLVAWAVIGALYLWILRRGIERHTEDVRSGVLVAMAEWAARRVTALDVVNLRAWKPNLLVPVRDPTELQGLFGLLSALAAPEGSVKVLGIAPDSGDEGYRRRVKELAGSLSHSAGLFTTWSVVDAVGFTAGVVSSIQALGSAFFRPNAVVLRAPMSEEHDQDLHDVLREAKRLHIGIVLVAMHPSAGLGRQQVVNVWLHPQRADEDVEQAFARSNLDLALLTAVRLARRWNAHLNLVSAVDHPDRVAGNTAYLTAIRERARIPEARILVLVGPIDAVVNEVPQSDLDLFGLGAEPDLERVRALVRGTRSSCLFLSDSGQESAFA